MMFLFSRDTEQLKPSLNVIKCGLFSKNSDVVNQASNVLTKIASVINENQSMFEMRGQYNEWLFSH